VLLPPEFSRYRERILHRGKAGVENPVERENVDKHGKNNIKNVELAKRIDGLFLLIFRLVMAPETERPMVKLALYVRLEAKPGQEATLKAFLESALPLAQGEASTPVWFALQFGPSTFGIFDAFADEAGRQAHLGGAIAAALMSKAGELLAVPPTIEKVDLLAAKLPG
jgi:quinol monooxygenase YgiN